MHFMLILFATGKALSALERKALHISAATSYKTVVLVHLVLVSVPLYTQPFTHTHKICVYMFKCECVHVR